MRRVTVLLGNPKKTPRQKVEAELLQENVKSLIVRLPDGNIIVRRKPRDIPEEGNK